MRVIISVLLLLASLTGCDSKLSESSKEQLPVVSDENCSPENVSKITPADARERFASSCLHRGNFKPSPKKEW